MVLGFNPGTGLRVHAQAGGKGGELSRRKGVTVGNGNAPDPAPQRDKGSTGRSPLPPA
jgi:hypothetical protein